MSDTKQPTITMYTTPTCGFCHMAKDYFDDNKIEFTQKDVAVDAEAQKEMIESLSKERDALIKISSK